MNRIAFIINGNFIYWNSLLLALGALVAIFFFLGLYPLRGKNPTSGFIAVVMSTALSLILARFIHWYCRTGAYESLGAAMTNLTGGSFALVGVFAGCLLTAVILRVIRVHKNLPQMLDCMSIAGAAGIALGRLASFFTSADRGQIIDSLQGLPWVYPITNSVSGAMEYRLATFLIQAMIAGILFLALSIFYIIGHNRKLKDGDTTLIFLLCYCGTQILLDSTRYDSIYFRSNGFVSVVQVLSAVALAVTIVWFSVRMVRSKGFKLWYLALWTAIALRIGGAGYMEYYVQRHGNEAAMAYTLMGICLVSTIFLTLVIRAIAVHGENAAAKVIEEACKEVIEEVIEAPDDEDVADEITEETFVKVPWRTTAE